VKTPSDLSDIYLAAIRHRAEQRDDLHARRLAAADRKWLLLWIDKHMREQHGGTDHDES
jgi:hypothetical protein